MQGAQSACATAAANCHWLAPSILPVGAFNLAWSGRLSAGKPPGAPAARRRGGNYNRPRSSQSVAGVSVRYTRRWRAASDCEASAPKRVRCLSQLELRCEGLVRVTGAKHHGRIKPSPSHARTHVCNTSRPLRAVRGRATHAETVRLPAKRCCRFSGV